MDTSNDLIYIYTPNVISWKLKSSVSVTYRPQGPASIRTSGHVLFYRSLRLFATRQEGPATIQPDGTLTYCTHSECKYHRTNGPAKISADGTREYWVYDQQISPENFFLQYGVM